MFLFVISSQKGLAIAYYYIFPRLYCIHIYRQYTYKQAMDGILLSVCFSSPTLSVFLDYRGGSFGLGGGKLFDSSSSSKRKHYLNYIIML